MMADATCRHDAIRSGMLPQLPEHPHFFSLGASISSGLTYLSKSSYDSALSSMADSLSVRPFL